MSYSFEGRNRSGELIVSPPLALAEKESKSFKPFRNFLIDTLVGALRAMPDSILTLTEAVGRHSRKGGKSPVLVNKPNVPE